MTSKRAHEQAKKDRAEAKRARREARASGDDDATAAPATDGRSEAELLDHLKNLQDAFGRGELTFERFDAERGQILQSIEALNRDDSS